MTQAIGRKVPDSWRHLHISGLHQMLEVSMPGNDGVIVLAVTEDEEKGDWAQVALDAEEAYWVASVLLKYLAQVNVADCDPEDIPAIAEMIEYRGEILDHLAECHLHACGSEECE